jgi:hypothetical protein
MSWPTIIGRYVRQLRNRIAYRICDYSAAPLARRFAAVYNDYEWAGVGATRPISGLGSSLRATVGVRNQAFVALQSLFRGKDRLRIIDAPCGDMTWMPELLKMLAPRFAGIEYLGTDIVPKLVAENWKIAPIAPNVETRFQCLDVTKDEIPACDLFFCKDLVNHLCNRDIFRLLMNLQQSGCSYAMITNNRCRINQELKLRSPGASRAVDLLAPPFSLPPPAIDFGYLTFWKLPFAVSDAVIGDWRQGAGTNGTRT